MGGTGTVFRLSTAGTEFTVLHRFESSTNMTTDMNPMNADGAFPEAELTEGTDGMLYGVTRAGGPAGRGAVRVGAVRWPTRRARRSRRRGLARRGRLLRGP